MSRLNLCPECRPKWFAWAQADMTTVMPVRFKIASGAAYDDTAHAVIARRRQRVEDFVALVNRQCRLIVDICARKHAVPEPTGPNGQFSLFDSLEDAA